MSPVNAITAGIFLPLLVSAATATEVSQGDLASRFKADVDPFIQTHCIGCHGDEQPEAEFDLTPYESLSAVRRDLRHWGLILRRLEANEMPPEDAPNQPTPLQKKTIVDWIRELQMRVAELTAGDPGPILPRRLSNAEYDNTVRDLTKVDIRPTHEFPIDPANEAGFDNSGESLTMSPALLEKYFGAARLVADHLVLLPEGFSFAPHPAVTDTDRDKFCVARIVNFYKRQPVDYADYFFAAWQHRHRRSLGKPGFRLSDFAARDQISVKYLAMVQAALTDTEHNAGPLAKLREMWGYLPVPDGDNVAIARNACERMREFVHAERRKFVEPVADFKVQGVNQGTQPLILRVDREVSANRRRGKLPESEGLHDTERLHAAVQRFCSLFPDAFFVSERGRMYLDPQKQNRGRYLSAGFHLMVGYYRDDQPLCDLILDEGERNELDRLWRELDFVTRAPIRQYHDFVYFERAEPPRFMASSEFDFARGEDKGVTSVASMKKLSKEYIAKARRQKIEESYLRVIASYFDEMSTQIRRVEKDRVVAQPSHLTALLKFTERAWRRPLTAADCEDLLVFYRELRDKQELEHEDAIRDTLISVLMSPNFCYRVDVPSTEEEINRLSDVALASRLSYFLWASMPDEQLMARVGAGELADRQVLLSEARRMLKDSRVRGFATEFGGQWLDIRRFQQHNGVNRERYMSFTSELRQAMYEEPLRFFVDLIRRDGSVLEFIEGKHTFVNATLAAHYGISIDGQTHGIDGENGDSWTRVDNAAAYGRGGVLPMSVFLTKNSPGLRTSPVKRGHWLVQRLLGEQIPPPPPGVPELPQDEAALTGDVTLRQLLAKHRRDKSCATCHDRFDAIGVAFEGYGPIGERRARDFGGRLIESHAAFPDGSERQGIEGLRDYLSEHREDDFIDNLCRRLLAYALGRTLLLSDEQTINGMKTRLAADGNRFGGLVESIVTSPQFLNQRGREFAARVE